MFFASFPLETIVESIARRYVIQGAISDMLETKLNSIGCENLTAATGVDGTNSNSDNVVVDDEVLHDSTFSCASADFPMWTLPLFVIGFLRRRPKLL